MIKITCDYCEKEINSTEVVMSVTAHACSARVQLIDYSPESMNIKSVDAGQVHEVCAKEIMRRIHEIIYPSNIPTKKRGLKC